MTTNTRRNERRTHVLVACGWLVLSVVIVVVAQRMPRAAGNYPRLVGLAMLVGVALVLTTLLNPTATILPEDVSRPDRLDGPRAVLAKSVFTALAGVLVINLGLLLGGGVASVVFFRLIADWGWRKSLAVASLLPVLLYVVFDVLQARLPTGVFG